jgi:hypothetical protein
VVAFLFVAVSVTRSAVRFDKKARIAFLHAKAVGLCARRARAKGARVAPLTSTKQTETPAVPRGSADFLFCRAVAAPDPSIRFVACRLKPAPLQDDKHAPMLRPLLLLVIAMTVPAARAAAPIEAPLAACNVHDGGDGYVPTVDKVRNFGSALVIGGINQSSFSTHTFTIPETAANLAKLEGKVNAYCANPGQFSSILLASDFKEVGKFLPQQDEMLKFIDDHGPRIAQAITDLGGSSGGACKSKVEAFLAKYKPQHEANKQKNAQLADKLKSCGAGKN